MTIFILTAIAGALGLFALIYVICVAFEESKETNFRVLELPNGKYQAQARMQLAWCPITENYRVAPEEEIDRHLVDSFTKAELRIHDVRKRLEGVYDSEITYL